MKKLIKAFCMSFSMFCAIPTPFAHIWEDSVRSLMLDGLMVSSSLTEMNGSS